MPRSLKVRQQRKAGVKRRAAEPSHIFKNCRVIDCKLPARAATGDGLDTRFCRKHADQYARHGSPYRTSYKAIEFAPYKKAADAWLRDHADDAGLRNGLQRVRGLFDRAGPHVEAFRLRGMTPRERANAAWARLRKHGVDPAKVIVAVLTVEAVSCDLPGAEQKREFRQVQIAKLIHRLASGSHRRWSHGTGGPTELHVYPVSRGQVLRYVGEDAEQAVELMSEGAVREMLEGFERPTNKHANRSA